MVCRCQAEFWCTIWIIANFLLGKSSSGPSYFHILTWFLPFLFVCLLGWSLLGLICRKSRTEVFCSSSWTFLRRWKSVNLKQTSLILPQSTYLGKHSTFHNMWSLEVCSLIPAHLLCTHLHTSLKIYQRLCTYFLKCTNPHILNSTFFIFYLVHKGYCQVYVNELMAEWLTASSICLSAERISKSSRKESRQGRRTSTRVYWRNT